MHRAHQHARTKPTERPAHLLHPAHIPDVRRRHLHRRRRVQLQEYIPGGARSRVGVRRLLPIGDEGPDALQWRPSVVEDNEIRRRRI